MPPSQRIEDIEILPCNDPDRLVEYDIGEITKDHTITTGVDGETFSGPVTRIDSYGDTTDVERVVQFNMSYKHYIDGPDWEPWKAYLVEEPAGIYRLNVVFYNGEASRTRNCTGPSEITVSSSE